MDTSPRTIYGKRDSQLTEVSEQEPSLENRDGFAYKPIAENKTKRTSSRKADKRFSCMNEHRMQNAI